MKVEKTERRISLDLLRIIATFFIITLHFLDRGTYLYTSVINNPWGIFSWFIEGIALAGVNIYVIISAFFLSDSSHARLGKVFDLWGQVFVTSVAVALVMKAAGFEMSGMDYVYAFLPFTTKQAWFVNVYVLMYLLHPFMNKVIAKMERHEYRVFLIILLLFFSAAQTFIPEKTWTMDSSEGCGILWFMTLYFVTGYYKKYMMKNGKPIVSVKTNLLVLLISAALMPISILLISFISNVTGHGAFAMHILYHYDSIPVFLGSFAVFGIVARRDNCSFRNGAKKMIEFIAPATLGIYLISTQGMLHMHLWTDILHVDRYVNSWKMIPAMAAGVLFVFTVSMLLDKLRHLLAVNTVDRLKIDKHVDEWQNRLIKRMML